MRKLLLLAFTLALLAGGQARAAFVLQNLNADGFVNGAFPGDFTLTGGNNLSGQSGVTTYTQLFDVPTAVTFSWSYVTADLTGFDDAGYVVNLLGFVLAAQSGDSGGPITVMVGAGDTFGWFVNTTDNLFGRGSLTVTDISTVAVPAPGALAMFGIGLLGLVAARRRSN